MCIFVDICLISYSFNGEIIYCRLLDYESVPRNTNFAVDKIAMLIISLKVEIVYKIEDW